jgi:predicted transglutaminase-like protease
MLNSKTAKKFQKVYKKPLNLFKGFDSSITFSIFYTHVEFAYTINDEYFILDQKSTFCILQS